MTKQFENNPTSLEPSYPEDDQQEGDVVTTHNSSDMLPVNTSSQNILLAAKGGGITFAGTLFNHISRLAIGVLLGRFLGAEGYGLYTLSLPIAEVAAGLAILGLTQAMVRYIAMFNSRRDTAGVWGTLQLGLGISTVMGTLVGFGLYMLAEPIANQLFDEPRLIPLLHIASVAVPLLALIEILAGATQGFKKMQYTAIAQNISMPLIKLSLVGGLAIIAGLSVASVLIVHIISLIIGCTMLLYFLHSLFSLKRSLRDGRYNVKEILAFSLPIYLSRLIKYSGGQIQTVLLAMFRTVTTVGIFSVATQVNKIGDFFHQAVLTASAPIFSELYDQNDQEQMARFYQTMTKWTLSLNLPLFLLLLLLPESILSIFGRDFVAGAVVLRIIAWSNLINAGTGICGVVLGMTGRTKLKLINTIISVALTIGLNIFLIPRWGLIGAAIAGLVATLLSNLLPLVQVFILYRLLPYNTSFIKPGIAAVAAIASMLIIDLQLPLEADVINLIVKGTMLFAIYIGVILLLGLSEEDRLVLSRLRRRMNIKFLRS